MQLNHLDLSVPDVAQTAAFFQGAFGFVHIESKGNHGMVVLEGDCRFLLVLSRARSPVYPKTFHIGFLLASESQVWDAYQRVTSISEDTVTPPRPVRGSLLFYCNAPGRILVEVSHRPAS